VKWVIDVAKNPSKAFDTSPGSGGGEKSGWDRTKGAIGSVFSMGSPVAFLRSMFGPGEQQVEERRTRASSEPAPTAPGGDMAASIAAAAGAGAAKAAPTEAQATQALIRRNMQDTLKELQMSMGPKASYQGIAQASKSAQLAALNQSPFEAKMLAKMQEVIGALTRTADNTTRQPSPRHNGG
jgi:hypothetical protein